MSQPTKLLRELIALPSVNPAFSPPNDPRTGEQRVADFLADTAARHGLEVELHEVCPGRSNLLARLGTFRKARRRVLLAPHMDTVGGESPEIFRPREKDGRLHGRGACDTKGSVAAMISALIELARSAQRPRQTEIVFAGLVDEENGQGGSRALIAKGFGAGFAIVGEPTRLQVVTAHKGDLWLQLETTGKAAHGARPDLGRNAVHAMSRIVHLLETKYARALRRHRHPVLGHPTINVGSIAGGRQPNIVPDHCVITVDRRTTPGETDAGVRREIKGFLREHNLAARLSDFKVVPCHPLATPWRAPLVQHFLKITGQARPVGVDRSEERRVGKECRS